MNLTKQPAPKAGGIRASARDAGARTTTTQGIGDACVPLHSCGLHSLTGRPILDPSHAIAAPTLRGVPWATRGNTRPPPFADGVSREHHENPRDYAPRGRAEERIDRHASVDHRDLEHGRQHEGAEQDAKVAERA